MTRKSDPAIEDSRVVYADIIDLPHRQSAVRPHMSLLDRAAQFAPFSALAGYEEMIGEEERETDLPEEASEERLESLDRTLEEITRRIAAGEHPFVSFTVFEPDERKQGGRFVQITDAVYTVDTAARVVVLSRREGRGGSRKALPLESIVQMRPEAE